MCWVVGFLPTDRMVWTFLVYGQWKGRKISGNRLENQCEVDLKINDGRKKDFLLWKCESTYWEVAKRESSAVFSCLTSSEKNVTSDKGRVHFSPIFVRSPLALLPTCFWKYICWFDAFFFQREGGTFSFPTNLVQYSRIDKSFSFPPLFW